MRKIQKTDLLFKKHYPNAFSQISKNCLSIDGNGTFVIILFITNQKGSLIH